jgi:hypothetical protein
LVITGAVLALSYNKRISLIRTTIRNNFPVNGNLNISPEIMFNDYYCSYSIGVSLKFRF